MAVRSKDAWTAVAKAQAHVRAFPWQHQRQGALIDTDYVGGGPCFGGLVRLIWRQSRATADLRKLCP